MRDKYLIDNFLHLPHTIPAATETDAGVMTADQVLLLESLVPGTSSGFVSVEFFRSAGDDFATCQAALDSGVPLLWPKRTYTMGVGQTLINTQCHIMLGADTTWKLGDNSTVNTDASPHNFTPFMQIQGVQGFLMLGTFTIDGNRDNQTYPATQNNFGRGTTTLTAAGRRTNASVIWCAGADNTTPTRHVRIYGDVLVKNGYLNGLCFWQTEDVVLDGVHTENNTINGISFGGVKGFGATNTHDRRDGVSAVYTSTRSGGDRAGIQGREMPPDFTAAALGMPCIPVQVVGLADPNFDVNYVDCNAEECEVEGFFMRACFPGRMINCYSKNVCYSRDPATSFHGSHFWGEAGYYLFDDCVGYQPFDNSTMGWQKPDVVICQTFEGNGATSSTIPMNISGSFRSSVRGLRATCGSTSGTTPQYNHNRGARIFSACTMSDYYIEGTSAEAVSCLNDVNFNSLPPHDIKLLSGNILNCNSTSAISFVRFSGGVSVVGTSDNIVVNGLTVRGLTTSAMSTDDHAVIDFDATMESYATHGLTLVGLDVDCTNAASANPYNGVRLRVNEASQNIRIDFARCFNAFSAVRTFGFQGLEITGEIDTAHRIFVGDNQLNTADSGVFRCKVNAVGVTSEMFAVLNMETWRISEWRIDEGCSLGGSSTCTTFSVSAPPNGGITRTPDNFFAQAKKFFWTGDVNNYGSASPSADVYDMRRTFTNSASLANATPYYVGEVVLTVDTTPNILWVGVSNRSAGAWSQLSGTLV